MNTNDLARELYEKAVINVVSTILTDLSSCSNTGTLSDFYMKLSDGDKAFLKVFIEMVAFNVVSQFTCILDNRAVGDFEDDFILTDKKSSEKLNNFELQDDFINMCKFEWNLYDS